MCVVARVQVSEFCGLKLSTHDADGWTSLTTSAWRAWVAKEGFVHFFGGWISLATSHNKRASWWASIDTK